MTLPHRAGCYAGERCIIGWERNPFRISVRGKDSSVFVPMCRVSRPHVAPLTDAVAEIARHIGLRIYKQSPGGYMGDFSSPPEKIEPFIWDEACRRSTPIAKVGGWGNEPVWVMRDVLREYARLVPRQVCGVCKRRMPRHHRDDKLHTYLISDGTYLKIGVSKHPRSRLNDLSTSNPRKLTLLAEVCGGYWEGVWHREFERFHVNREWFRDRREIREKFGIAPLPVKREMPLLECTA